MFKVFIADDEQYIVEGLVVGVPWEEYGFTVCGTAGDGQSALSEIERLKPDVVITDIKMPCLSGLELIARIKEKFPEIMIVIISGYAEFEYAQTAIKHGVDGYTLKPIETSEIIEYLKKFNEILRRRLKEKQSTCFLEAIENDNGKYFEKYFSGNAVQCILSNGGCLAFLDDRAETVACRIARNMWLYFSPEQYTPERIDNMANDGVSGVGVVLYNTSVDLPSDCVNEAITRSYKYFMSPGVRVCAVESDAQSVRRYNFLLGCLLQQIQSRDAAAVNQTMESMSVLIPEISIAELYRSFITLEALRGIDDTEDECTAGNGFHVLAEKWTDADACFNSFKRYVQGILYPHMEHTTVYAGNRLISEVLSYLQENYKETPTLYDLAERFHVNQAYLSRLFKKETGLTPLEYLTQYKMEKACALLRKTNLSVNEVAQETGYNDYLYFRKVFKKYCGETPTAYRKQTGAISD